MTPPASAPSPMDRLNTATQSAEAASTARGAALIIHVCRPTDTPPVGEAPDDQQEGAADRGPAEEQEQGHGGGEGEGDDEHAAVHVAREGRAGREVADHARGAEAEEQRGDVALVDPGELLEGRAHEGVRGEVPEDDEGRRGDAHAHARVAQLLGEQAWPDGLRGGQRRQYGEQGDEHDEGQGAHGGEGDAPAGEFAEEGAEGDAEDVRGADAAEDDRGGAGDVGGGHEAYGQTAGDGPEAADRDPDEHPGGHEDGEVRGQGRGHVGEGHQPHQREEQDAPVESSDEYGHQRRGDRGDEAGHGDHQPGGPFGDRQRGPYGGEQADRQLLGGHQQKGPEGHGGDREPVVFPRDGRRGVGELLGGGHGVSFRYSGAIAPISWGP